MADFDEPGFFSRIKLQHFPRAYKARHDAAGVCHRLVTGVALQASTAFLRDGLRVVRGLRRSSLPKLLELGGHLVRFLNQGSSGRLGV
jgi:hypothetical protein